MRKRSLYMAVVFVLFAAVSVFAKVAVSYDPDAQFYLYHTYMWLKPVQLSDPQMGQHVMDTINAQLNEKGWRVVSADGDISIAVNGATPQKHTLQSFYQGLNGWTWRGWDTSKAAGTESYPVGTLLVDLFDAHSQQIVWRAVSAGTLSEKDTKKVDDAITEMFKDFPPKATGNN